MLKDHIDHIGGLCKVSNFAQRLQKINDRTAKNNAKQQNMEEINSSKNVVFCGSSRDDVEKTDDGKEDQVKKIGNGEKPQWMNEKWLVFFDSAKQDFIAVNPLEESIKQVPLGLSDQLSLPRELHSSTNGLEVIVICQENKNEVSVYMGTSRWR